MKDYKKILEGVVDIINATEKSDIGFVNICTYIGENCPELKESEDEMIRKVLLDFLKNELKKHGDEEWDGCFHTTDMIAWLEKQDEKSTLPKWKYKKDNTPLLRDSLILNKYGCVAKSPSGALVNDVWVIDYAELAKLPKEEFEKQGEQKPDPVLDIEIPFGAKDSELQEASYYIPEGFHAEIESNRVVIKRGEQKPAEWSEEDERMFNSALWHVKNSCGNQGKNSGEFEVYNWLKSLKERVLPKKEWSEDDECKIDKIVKVLDYVSNNNNLVIGQIELEDLKNWLKSLRPQNKWKPSDEQMKALKEACDEYWEPDGLDPLYVLWEQLKKLREE